MHRLKDLLIPLGDKLIRFNVYFQDDFIIILEEESKELLKQYKKEELIDAIEQIVDNLYKTQLKTTMMIVKRITIAFILIWLFTILIII